MITREGQKLRNEVGKDRGEDELVQCMTFYSF